jgi:glycosyltransferase involved in cell wall biosynthesis
MPTRDQKPIVALLFGSILWKQGAGLWARSRELCRYLGRHTTLHLIHVGREPVTDSELRQATGCQKILELRGVAPSFPEFESRLGDFVRQHQIQTVIFEKTESASLASFVPAGVCKIVDTHDIVSDRAERMKRFGLRSIELSRAQEIELLARFDAAIAIQGEDRAKLSGWLGADRVLLAPHPVEAEALPVRPKVRSVGLLASAWPANVEGLNWFIQKVWPTLESDPLELKIFGWVGKSLKAAPGVKLCGFAESCREAYQELDIVINPVRAGAGLKIKSVEALGFGRPLVTTSEGARGLTELDGRALLIADDEASFARQLRRVIDEPELRAQLSRGALEFVRTNLTAPQCFNPLLRFLKAEQARGGRKKLATKASYGD